MKLRFLLVVLTFLSSNVFSLDTPERSPRLLIHLLDYIALDYPGAVKNGKVLSESEFKEQQEFGNTLVELNESIPELKNTAGIGDDLRALQKAINSKAPEAEIEKRSRDLKWKVIGVSGIQLSPSTWPNLEEGRLRYQQNCAVCHGDKGYGDGPAGKALDPKPANFHEEKMDHISPFQAFNAIRLGVPGTAMASFSQFTDQQVWELAFYVVSFRHRKGDDKTPIVASSSAGPTVGLQQVATQSDAELQTSLSGNEAVKTAALNAIRLRSGGGDETKNFLFLAKSELENALTEYRAGRMDSAKKNALSAYLNGIEPIEPRLRASDPSLFVEVEERMTQVRSAIDGRKELSEIETRVQKALDTIGRVDSSLKSETSPAMTFVVSAGIVTREAFEAILLIITLLGVIRSIGSKRAALSVHLGWILAVGFGFGAWAISGWVLQISGAHRETLEGFISLLAVGVVLYMGFWLHRKTEIGRWRAFLNQMAETVMSGKSLVLLAGISFMAVFREAFETVLFLRAVLLESGDGHHAAMTAGVLSALFFVIVLATALVRFSARIPIRQLFDISSFIMVILSFILMGKAIHSFQEAGLLSVTEFPISMRLDLFGLYPTYESLVPQFIILVVSLSFWLSGRRPSVRPA